MKIVACDLSLTETGFAAAICGDARGTRVQSGVLAPPQDVKRKGVVVEPGVKGIARIEWIRMHLISYIVGASLVVLEDYSFGSNNAYAREIAELGGVIRWHLHVAGIEWKAVPPATLKLFATGKGNADKTGMVVAARERFGFAGQNHNEADAFLLLHAALESVGMPLVKVPLVQRAALAKVWPKLARAA